VLTCVRSDSSKNGGLQPADEDAYDDEETRYDALGRRIWVHSVHVDSTRFGFCNVFCSVARSVWDGDQLLGEFRMPVEQRENDTAAIFVWQPVPDSEGIFHKGGDSVQTYSWLWGRAIYTHGLGIDQPIAITRAEGGDSTTLFDPFTMYPQADYRGNVTAVAFAGSGTRNYDVGDCPDDKVGNAMRALAAHGGEIGKQTIRCVSRPSCR
jgi:hypothetical protein